MTFDKHLSYVDKIPANILLLILFTILIIFIGASISIQLFTYSATTSISQENQRNILMNKGLNYELLNQTREIPQQNKMMLEDLTDIVSFLGTNFGSQSGYLDRENAQYIQANNTFRYLNQSVDEIKEQLREMTLTS